MSRVAKAEFRRRRQRLMAGMADHSIAIIPSASLTVRNRDIHYPFRQDSDFYYLTGFEEPDSWLVLCPGREQGTELIFCLERNPEWEEWHGPLAGPERVVSLLGVDDAFPSADLDEILPGLIEGRSRVYTIIGANPRLDHMLMEWTRTIRQKQSIGALPPEDFSDLRHLLHEQRLVKSAAEISLLRKAADISVAAHKRMLKCVRPGVFEYQLQAELEYEFMRSGAQRVAYPPIVASGANACILHYSRNDKKLGKDGLLMVDAGCEYQYYAMDISRTYPINGHFSAEQRQLYELVLAAQNAAISVIRPGVAFDLPHQMATKIMTEGLLAMGWITGSYEAAMAQNLAQPFFKYRTSHWLGLDAHDVGDYRIGGQWRILEPGMVLTVEPGIYIQVDNDRVSPALRGTGIRIEDTVLVTRDGHDVLSGQLPKTVEDIENLMAGRQWSLL
ncbi:aminopeptidase P N-terminal domain-containing protein [Gynuella sunshinyii]|uniref:Xaa-Pro aminopeptidase n=1 Tax=Gynuella sunshinyii YC6258 TaxID=1445510 RepID=A0A0C5VTA0_9GAMM|nr:aminopeptidase P N-terminal domain-containing protein [Gynuella sunshinyii]AJQ93544.1 xaa-Pro aminopeptidase [Gynuella sunshinyii YC6258]